MKKILSIGTGILAVGLILKGSGIIDALMFFIIIGALPGTSTSLSPTMTMAILTTLVTMSIIYIVTAATPLQPEHAMGQKKPTRRYSKI